ncbi:MAG: methyltransferase domain-containing protein [Planctomycetota bacterium]
MPPVWTFLDATVIERASFVDLERTLARAETEPVLPPNRWRNVHRVHSDDGGVYWLKRFTRTQAKNRWRNRWSQPRCTHDAEREVRMAQDLQARGFRAARAVALGIDGAASCCLLANLAGESLRDRFLRTGVDPRTVLAAADFAGALVRAGFVLPDLSLEHVFATPNDQGGVDFGVIDLHRGRRGRASGRDLVRMLRRTIKSAAGIVIARRFALRAAVRMLRASGHGTRTRAVISALPPFDTHGRYDAALRAKRYGERSRSRDGRERSLLASVWPFAPGAHVLDLPCGRGRLRSLCEDLDTRWHGADRSRAMLAEAAQGKDPTADDRLACADALAMPFADRAFDGVIVFRFLHHVPDDIAHAVCREAARIADGAVLVSFFHPVSAHHLMRTLRSRIFGRPQTRFARALSALDAWFDAAGFRRVAVAAEAAYRRDLWIAVYRRSR